MAKKAEIKLYGDITSWNENSAAAFTDALEKLKKNNENVTVRMHCMGGSVFEGNVISNAIAEGGKADIQIDGIAASMGAFILPFARRVTIAKNAYVMIHAPQSSINGTAEDLEKEAKLIRSFEDNFKSRLKEKTKQPDDIIAKWFVGENWFSAQEALAVGLVNEIIEPVAQVEIIAKTDLAGYSEKSLYSRYTAFLSNNNLKFSKMDKKEVIARYGLAGVMPESADADIYAAIDKKIADERSAKESAERSLSKEKEKQITAAVDAAVSAKKITDAQKVHFVTIGKTAGIEALHTVLDAIKTVPTITGLLGGKGGGSTDDRTAWNWDKWQKEDSKGLERLAQSDYDSFNALYKAEFGVDAPK